jgi:dodecin
VDIQPRDLRHARNPYDPDRRTTPAPGAGPILGQTGKAGSPSRAATFSPCPKLKMRQSKEHLRGKTMAMLKVIEVLAESDKSWDDAAASAVAQASKTVRNIKSIYVENMQAMVEGNKIVKYRINAKITFSLE